MFFRAWKLSTPPLTQAYKRVVLLYNLDREVFRLLRKKIFFKQKVFSETKSVNLSVIRGCKSSARQDCVTDQTRKRGEHDGSKT